MDQTWFNIYSVLLIFTLAIVSPGPNFILVVNRSLTENRQTGLYTAFGVATGSGLFALSGLLGLILVVNSLPYFSILAPFLGGGYLVYLGVSMILSRNQRPATETDKNVTARSGLTSYLSGLMTNLTNPKAWAFYLSLFTLFVDTRFPFWAKVFLVICMFLISLIWYAAMAFLVSDQRIQRHFLNLQPVIKTVLGALMIVLGGRLLFRS